MRQGNEDERDCQICHLGYLPEEVFGQRFDRLPPLGANRAPEHLSTV
jgi:hypothetical protein